MYRQSGLRIRGPSRTRARRAKKPRTRIFNSVAAFFGSTLRLIVLFAALLLIGGQVSGLWTPFSSRSGPAPQAQPASIEEIWSRGPEGAAENAASHFRKHGHEFPYASQDEYVRAALSFVAAPPPGTLSVVQGDGDQVSYNPDANLFAVVTRDGKIRTFFRPDPAIHGYDTNLDYFNAQAGR